MTGLNYNKALFVKMQKENEKMTEAIIPLHHIIIISIQSQYLPSELKDADSRINNHISVSSTSISIPIPLAAKNDCSVKSSEVLLDDYFHGEQYTQSFFPYPEQGSPRSPVPSFRLMYTRDKLPIDTMMVRSRIESDA